MIRRWAAAAKFQDEIGNHSFWATGVTACLEHGGTLEKAAVARALAVTDRSVT
jgi:hypothetical protein